MNLKDFETVQRFIEDKKTDNALLIDYLQKRTEVIRSFLDEQSLSLDYHKVQSLHQSFLDNLKTTSDQLLTKLVKLTKKITNDFKDEELQFLLQSQDYQNCNDIVSSPFDERNQSCIASKLQAKDETQKEVKEFEEELMRLNNDAL